MDTFRKISTFAAVLTITMGLVSGQALAAPKAKSKAKTTPAAPADSAPAAAAESPSYSSGSSGSGGSGQIAKGMTSINVPVGLMIFTGAGSTTRFAFGVDGTHMLTDDYGIGGYFKLALGTGTVWALGAQGEYRLPSMRNLGLGFQMGILNNSVSVTVPILGTVSASSTTFTLGPKVNYDYFIQPNMSIGGEADVHFITDGSSFAFGIFGTAKYWL